MEPSERAGVPFGRYLIRRRLGTGGMGEVFLADQLGPLGPVRPVALKRLRPTLAGDPGAVRAFLEEMGIAAQLTHPNIATTYDFGETDGVYFLAMEYVDGVTLDRLLEATGPVSLPVAIAIGQGALTALEVAHGRRGGPVVHQDVSPHNLMISREGVVKLLDFGIAKAEAQVLGGRLRAKVPYAAPEQLRGEPPDRRFDLWALGVTLYEALVGARPFATGTAEEALAATSAGLYPSLASRCPSAAALEPVIAAALEPDQNRRLANAEAFRAALLGLGVAPASAPALAELVQRVPTRVIAEDEDVTGTGIAALARPEPLQEGLPTEAPSRPPVEPARDDGPTSKLGPRRRSYGWVAIAFLLGGIGTGLWRWQERRTQAAAWEESLAPTPSLAGAGAAPPEAPKSEPTPAPAAEAEAELTPTQTLPAAPREVSPAPDPRPPKAPASRERRSKARPKLAVTPAPAPVPVPAEGPPSAPANETGLGVLAIRTTPWAKVVLDGQALGDGIIAGKPVTAGKHQLTLTPGDGTYAARSIEINVRPGGVTKIFADFASGEIRVEAP